MRKLLIIPFTIICLLVSLAATADATTKKPFLDELMKRMLDTPSDKDLIETRIQDTVFMDPNIKIEKKREIIADLANISREDIIARALKELDKQVNEEEVKYIVNLLQSPLGNKLAQVRTIMTTKILGITDEKVQDRFKRLGITYTPPQQRTRQRVAPNWLTKIVWKVYPDQENACQ